MRTLHIIVYAQPPPLQLPRQGTTLPSPDVCYLSRHWLHLAKHCSHPGNHCSHGTATSRKIIVASCFKVHNCMSNSLQELLAMYKLSKKIHTTLSLQVFCF